MICRDYPKVYLNVPYANKDEAKGLGAKWDATLKKWYVPITIDIAPFAKWQTSVELSKMPASGKSVAIKNSSENENLGPMTYPTDPNFVAYAGDEPPWD